MCDFKKNNQSCSAEMRDLEKGKSLFKNYIFNLLKTISGVAFPVITFAYASRVLGAEGIGRVNFAKSVVSYFVMIALLGMNEYGTRECAKLRDDSNKLSKFVHEMLIINTMTTIVSYVLLLIVITNVPKLQEDQQIILISSLAVFLRGMGMDWLYQGLEEYRYIAMRSVLFQGIAMIALLVLVRDATDVLPYTFVLLLATYGSYVLNFFNARRIIHFQWYGNYELKKHLKPLLWLFALAVSIELYTVLDTTMLGFFQDSASVGRYTASVKINKLIVTVITAIGVVLIPRLSYYIEKSEKEKVNILVDKVFNYVSLLSIPAAIGLFVLSDDIIQLFSGTDFLSAAGTMRILTPIVAIIPLSVVTNIQIFVPMGKEKMVLLSTTTGAVVNMAGNIVLIPRYAENGAAAATVVAETMVTIVSLFCARKFYNIRIIFSRYYQYWIAAAPIPLIAWIVQKAEIGRIIRMGIIIVTSAFCYFLILIIFKNNYFIEVLQRIINKVKHRLKS